MKKKNSQSHLWNTALNLHFNILHLAVFGCLIRGRVSPVFWFGCDSSLGASRWLSELRSRWTPPPSLSAWHAPSSSIASSSVFAWVILCEPPVVSAVTVLWDDGGGSRLLGDRWAPNLCFSSLVLGVNRVLCAHRTTLWPHHDSDRKCDDSRVFVVRGKWWVWKRTCI